MKILLEMIPDQQHELLHMEEINILYFFMRSRLQILLSSLYISKM